MKNKDKFFVIFTNLVEYLRQKSYGISELYQHKCKQIITRKNKSIIKAIQKNFIKNSFTIAQLIPNIFINKILYDKEKYNKVMSKMVGIISKLVSN